MTDDGGAGIVAISEADRHRMHAGLIDKLGEEVADVLVEHLPPRGWADVATKQDVDTAVALLRAEMRAEVAGLRKEMADLARTLTAEMVKQGRTQIASMAFLATVLSTVSVYFH